MNKGNTRPESLPAKTWLGVDSISEGIQSPETRHPSIGKQSGRALKAAKEGLLDPFAYWTTNMAKAGEIPVARFFELFGEGEWNYTDAKETIARLGIDLTYFNTDMPDKMAEEGLPLDMKILEEVTPLGLYQQNEWVLVSAEDNEDSQIFVLFARPMHVSLRKARHRLTELGQTEAG